MERKRYVQIGLGARSSIYYDFLAKGSVKQAELVALCDLNPVRLEYARQAVEKQGVKAAAYLSGDFEKMIREQRPHTVIVTTKDSTHDGYICRAMELGCDVITEKPMTMDETRCAKIIETQRRTGRKITVTFNYRYSPPRTQIKDLLMGGIIGDVISVDFHWMLDTRHGADYFRRWHSSKSNSGGLMVHKATHHFDLINWWLSTVPVSVFARGSRAYYTAKTADRMGLRNRGERCHGCAESAKCPFFLDLEKHDDLRHLYLEAEQHDGYLRDRCIFRDSIEIEDNMSVCVKYRNGATLSYSLNAFMPWEGYTISINGTKGRLEHKCVEASYNSGDGSVQGELVKDETYTAIFPNFRSGYRVPLWTGEGGHGGGDPVMLDALLNPEHPADKYKRISNQWGGAYSILTGVAANHSMRTGKDIRIDDLVQGLELPEFTPMPSEVDAIPLAGDNSGKQG